jgi:hypothetical protein
MDLGLLQPAEEGCADMTEPEIKPRRRRLVFFVLAVAFVGGAAAVPYLTKWDEKGAVTPRGDGRYGGRSPGIPNRLIGSPDLSRARGDPRGCEQVTQRTRICPDPIAGISVVDCREILKAVGYDLDAGDILGEIKCGRPQNWEKKDATQSPK